MKGFRIALVILIIFVVNICLSKEEYNILVAIPVASRSLHNLFSSLALALAKDGHSVTLLTSFNQTSFHPNLVHFQPGDFSSAVGNRNFFEPMSMIDMSTWVKNFTSEITHTFWQNEDIKRLYEKRNKFNAIIFPSYANDMFTPFLDDFNGTIILFCTPGVEYNTISHYGNWLSLAVTPNLVLPYDDYMSFWERSKNLFCFFSFSLIHEIVFRPQFLASMREYFPHYDQPTSYYRKTSLTLINGHFALDGPVPLLPNQVEVGTINAVQPQPLSKELEEFVMGAGEAGVIYFSLGSIILGKHLPLSLKGILLETFRKIPQRVIWKYEENDLDLPPNVIVRKWLPQQDILGHKQTRIFMSHCGNLGTQEAKYHGVPVLAIPVAFDQPRNAARLVRKKYGITVSLEEMSVEKLIDAINVLINDKSYYDRMQTVSKLLQDQKESPSDRAVWWVKYVIRHNGAPHLRYAGQRLHFLQYIMMDVLVFWGMALLILLFFIHRICKFISKSCLNSLKIKRD